MGRPRSWTDDDLVAAVASAKSMKAVCRSLGIAQGGRGTVRRHIERLKLSTEHFTPYDDGIRVRQLTDDEYFVKGVSRSNNHAKSRLISGGYVEWRCATPECGVSEWLGKSITLQLEHINGDKLDFRRTNLCLLCPNCHSQTETYGGGNTSSARAKRELT